MDKTSEWRFLLRNSGRGSDSSPALSEKDDTEVCRQASARLVTVSLSAVLDGKLVGILFKTCCQFVTHEESVTAQG